MASAPSNIEVRGDWDLSRRLQHLLDSGEGSDIVFLVGAAPNQIKYSVHKAILSASSGVFFTMFYGALKTEDSVINLPDIDSKAFHQMLVYIYTDRITFGSVDEARLVLYAAKKYLLNHLSSKCRDYMTGQLGPGNVCSLYKFSQSVIGEEDLAEKCLKVICVRTSEILKDPNFLEVTSSMVNLILDQENLAVKSELEILKALISWSEQECRRQGLQVTPANKRKIMEFALLKIRFLSLTSTEFVKNTDIYEILTPEETSAILSNLVHPNTRPMPENLCSNTKARNAKTFFCPRCGAPQKPENLTYSESQETLVPVVSTSTSHVSVGSEFSFGSVLGVQASQSCAKSVITGSGSQSTCIYCGYNYKYSIL